ncbi:MAG: D-2-hydroxyacid dehydrogenase family protein [Propionibacteriales bacterium]|nr:D-2-hydroxyacid dehydrogenase family protein [Propionibacteriales bacterium]
MRIVVLDDYQGVARRFGPWGELGDQAEVTVLTEHIADEDRLVEALREADVVMAMRERTPIPAALLDRLPALRLLVTTGMHNASIDVAAARARGVTVCGTRILPSPAAELTWALLLGLVRHLPAEDAGVRSGEWQLTVGTELAGKTLGVIGLGRLGQRVARVGLAFEMRVVAWSQNLDPAVARDLGVEPVGKDELLAQSDVVTLHLRLSDRTRGIIGAPELGRMKPTAYLVNTSRGPLVDEDALLSALADGRIAGAGLDVFDMEPLPLDHPLRTSPRTVLSPHLGYVTDGTYDLFFTDAVEDIAAYVAGAPVRTLS